MLSSARLAMSGTPTRTLGHDQAAAANEADDWRGLGQLVDFLGVQPLPSRQTGLEHIRVALDRFIVRHPPAVVHAEVTLPPMTVLTTAVDLDPLARATYNALVALFVVNVVTTGSTGDQSHSYFAARNRKELARLLGNFSSAAVWWGTAEIVDRVWGALAIVGTHLRRGKRDGPSDARVDEGEPYLAEELAELELARQHLRAAVDSAAWIASMNQADLRFAIDGAGERIRDELGVPDDEGHRTLLSGGSILAGRMAVGKSVRQAELDARPDVDADARITDLILDDIKLWRDGPELVAKEIEDAQAVKRAEQKAERERKAAAKAAKARGKGKGKAGGGGSTSLKGKAAIKAIDKASGKGKKNKPAAPKPKPQRTAYQVFGPSSLTLGSADPRSRRRQAGDGPRRRRSGRVGSRSAPLAPPRAGRRRRHALDQARPRHPADPDGRPARLFYRPVRQLNLALEHGRGAQRHEHPVRDLPPAARHAGLVVGLPREGTASIRRGSARARARDGPRPRRSRPRHSGAYMTALRHR